jgi:hypothetical protein
MQEYQRFADASKRWHEYVRQEDGDLCKAMLRRLPTVSRADDPGLVALAVESFQLAIGLHILGDLSAKELHTFFLKAARVLDAQQVVARVSSEVSDSCSWSEDDKPELRAKITAVFTTLIVTEGSPYRTKPVLGPIRCDSTFYQDAYDQTYVTTLLDLLPISFDLAVEAVRSWAERVSDTSIDEDDVELAALSLFQKRHPDVELDWECARRDMGYIYNRVSYEEAERYARRQAKDVVEGALFEIRDVVEHGASKGLAAKLLRAAGVVRQ